MKHVRSHEELTHLKRKTIESNDLENIKTFYKFYIVSFIKLKKIISRF